MMRLLLCFALATAVGTGCLASEEELATGAMTNGTLDEASSTVVALYGTQDVPTGDGGTLPIILGPASGVLLCPGVVLTAMHVAENLTRFGPLTVSNRPVVWTPAEIVVHHRFWFDERLQVRVAVPGDALTVPAGEARVEAVTTNGQLDGFLMLPIDRPYSADLAYPTLATTSPWTKGAMARVVGYGNSAAGVVDGGTRLTGTAPFDRYLDVKLRRGAPRPPPLLHFGSPDTGVIVENGDSGGPSYGPLVDGATTPAPLAGIHAQSNEWSRFSDLDVAAYAPVLESLRTRMCAGAPPTTVDAGTGPLEPASDDTLERGAVAAQDALHLEEGDVVCVCHEDCAIDCP